MANLVKVKQVVSSPYIKFIKNVSFITSSWDYNKPQLAQPTVYPVNLELQDVELLRRSFFKPNWQRPDISKIPPESFFGKNRQSVDQSEKQSLGMLFHYVQCMRKTEQKATEQRLQLDLLPKTVLKPKRLTRSVLM